MWKWKIQNEKDQEYNHQTRAVLILNFIFLGGGGYRGLRDMSDKQICRIIATEL